MKGPCLACFFTMLAALGGTGKVQGQKITLDSLLTASDRKSLDSLAKDLNDFLDYYYKEKSFFSTSLTAANGYYDFNTNKSAYLQASSHLALSPSISYYHRTGFGLSASGFALDNFGSLDFYQCALSPSYAYLKSSVLAFGVGYTHYFTKKSLPFYTTPLNNEWYGWFTIKKWWLEPSVAFGYALGTKEQYSQRIALIDAQPTFRVRGEFGRSSTSLAVRDYALSFSLKHDFMFTHVFSAGGFLMITPLVVVGSGTQNFGFNTTYSVDPHVLNNFMLGSENSSATMNSFELRSWTFILTGDYSIHQFFLQPQIILDNYLADTNEKRFQVIAAISAGLNF
jgi:hypothetical protein